MELIFGWDWFSVHGYHVCHVCLCELYCHCLWYCWVIMEILFRHLHCDLECCLECVVWWLVGGWEMGGWEGWMGEGGYIGLLGILCCVIVGFHWWIQCFQWYITTGFWLTMKCGLQGDATACSTFKRCSKKLVCALLDAVKVIWWQHKPVHLSVSTWMVCCSIRVHIYFRLLAVMHSDIVTSK
jgi:hypothetical protein